MKRIIFVALLSLWAGAAQAILACSSADDNFDDPDGGPTGNITTVTWLVGQPVPSLDVGPEQFVTCAANGNELAYIRTKFSDLPMRSGLARTVIWRGEPAVFIIDNL